MKRLLLLALVGLCGIALGAARTDFPAYVPDRGRNSIRICAYERDLLTNRISGPERRFSGEADLVTLSGEMCPNALYVTASVETPREILAELWEAEVRKYLNAVASKASSCFSTPAAALVIELSINLNKQWTTAYLIQGQSKTFAADALEAEKRAAREAARQTAGSPSAYVILREARTDLPAYVPDEGRRLVRMSAYELNLLRNRISPPDRFLNLGGLGYGAELVAFSGQMHAYALYVTASVETPREIPADQWEAAVRKYLDEVTSKAFRTPVGALVIELAVNDQSPAAFLVRGQITILAADALEAEKRAAREAALQAAGPQLL